MPKKVFELANELGIGAVDLVDKLKSMGLNVRNHMVTLQDDEVAKAMESLGSTEQKAPAKKTVVKKKKTGVARKKVVKKVVRKTTDDDGVASETQTVIEAKPVDPASTVEESSEEKAKVTTVVRKKKVVKRVAKKENDDETEVYKEKMHSFTPIFVPEVKEEESGSGDSDNNEDSDRKEVRTTADRSSTAVDDEKGGASKKRMGDLAAIVSKKGVSTKAKDMTQIRADEEMKLASSILGKIVYTPAGKKKIFMGEKKKTKITEVKDSKRVISIYGVVTASELAQKLSQKFDAFQNKCLSLNLLVKKEDYIGVYLANQIAELYDYRAENKAFDEDKALGKEEVSDKSSLPLRNPIITVMGHVDHGKTTLLDYIRSTKVTSGEAGGITQHIGAYSVEVSGSTLTFLDTPGHAAFGAMRQRGADVTDIVILVVAADDGVMPQTKESIRYAQNSGCPIIVAVNKMDKESANPERIKQELTEFQLVSEEWGGDTVFSPISALNGDGIDDLLESVKLQAEMMELRESPVGAAEGVIIESKVEAGRGPVTTVLVKKGTLNKGDAVVVGECYGRARTLMDTLGKSINSAGPSIPVQILGINEPPSPGDILNIVKNEREAKKIVDNRIAERKKLENIEAPKVASLEDFFNDSTVETGGKKILKLIVRADVQGSYEAIKNAIIHLGNDEVGVEIIAGGVGAITENDIQMATSSQGYVIGFNMRPVTSARKLSEQNGVDVRTYSIIYELIDDVTKALEGMLEPESIEKYIGRAEVRDTFNIPKIGMIAGCGVIDGKIERGCNIRLLREGKIVFDGKLSTLKRFKDEVKEVGNGYECGMALEGFNDIKSSDLIEAYILEKKERKLEQTSY